MPASKRIAVVVPAYKVTRHVMDVLAAVPDMVDLIYVVDDACPDGSGDLVREQCRDARVKVLWHKDNQGVGGAVISGYRQALLDGADVVVKVDGDGQMDPALIPRFVNPIALGQADYAKGNRFYKPESMRDMPSVRLIGNLGLSLITKFSSGYWSSMDPTNGYTAVSARVLEILPLEKIDRRFFFETDMLFRLGTVRAVVQDVPMNSIYGDEISNLNIRKVLPEFLKGNLKRIFKRYVYTYLVRDFNLGSLYSLFGSFFLLFGVIFGLIKWHDSSMTHIPSTSGAVMLSGLAVIIGVQFLIAFLQYDVGNVPSRPISLTL